MPTRNGNAPRGSATSNTVAERLPHRSRSFNIANLPHDIREQLNLRLLDGEPGRELAAWLNALPSVQSVLGAQFNASPISEVNLTLWRQGGYLQWLTERECFDSARALADGDGEVAKTGFSAERLLNVLTVRIGQLLMRWDCASGEGVSGAGVFSEVARKARILQGISRSVLAIYRIQSQRSNTSASLLKNDTHVTADSPKSVPVASPHRAPSANFTPGLPAAASLLFPAPKGRAGARPAILSGPIVPSNISSILSHTPFKPGLHLAEILAAV